MSDDNIFYRMIVQLRHSISGKALPMLVGVIGLYFLYQYLKKYICHTYRSFFGLACVFAFFQVISFPFSQNNSLKILYCCGFQILKSIVIFFGFFFFFYNSITAFYGYLENGGNNVCHSQISYWKTTAIMFLVWLPHVLVQYPAGFTPDSIWQLEQGVGILEMSAHHPPFHSWLMGMCTLFGGKCFGSNNVGIFIFILLQFLTMVSVFSYSIFYLVRKGTSKSIIYGIWMIYAVCPLLTGYIGIVLKDVLYSAFFVWFIISCVRFMDNKMNGLDAVSVVCLSVSGTFMILTRKEGKIVVCITMLLLSIYTIKKNIRKADQVVKGVLILIVPLMISSIITNTLNDYYDITPGNRKEAFSLPFQQTARTVLEHSDEIPDEEKAVIDKILGYDTLAERYNPMLSDPVKNYYYSDAAIEDLLEYGGVWLKEFIRYPFTYLEATLNQNFPLLSIYADDRVYYHTTQLTFNEELQDIVFDYAWLEEINQVFVEIYYLLHDLPFVQLICSRSFYCMMMLIFTVFVFCSGKRDYWMVLVPLWIVFAVCIFGPAVNGHPRYVFPIVYSIPFLYGHYMSGTQKGYKQG